MLKLISIAIVFTLVTSLSPTYAQEQVDQSGVSISPVRLDLNADPGDTLSNQIKLYNPTDGVISISLKMQDIQPVGDDGDLSLTDPDDNSSYSVAKWVTITPTEVTLNPKEQKTVDVTINIPNDAEPGGHFGNVLASTISAKENSETGSSVSTGRGTHILMRVSGDVTESLVIDEFTAPSFSEYGPIDFEVIFQNTGNVHLRPAGYISITNSAGKEIAQLDLPQKNVLPEAKRSVETQLEDKRLIGRYTALVVGNYGFGSKQVVSESITFVVFPWKIAAAGSLGLLVTIFLLVKMRGRLKNAAKALAGK